MNIVLALALLVATFITLACGKGSFGTPRSFGGGYNRVGKAGWYSQNYRYRTTGMYWIYGSRYYNNHDHYDGPQNRLGSGAYNDDQARDVLCKRNISYDRSTVTTPYIDYNSTMTCFKQLYSAPGDPGNIYLEDLMLDRYVWRVSVASYPTFDLVVFPDKDITEADMNITLRLRRLIFLPSTTAFGSGSEEEVDLSTLTWSPCTLEACDTSATNQFSYPSSRFIDNNRMTTSAVTAIYNSILRITIRVWLADDFNEDPFFEHVFVHPAQMKIDVSLEAIGTGTVNGTFVGLEAVIASTATDKGSVVNPIKIDDKSSPVVYDPAVMNRVQFGDFNDIAERKAANFAWFTSTNKNKLCYNDGDAACVRFLNWGGLNTTCTEGSVSDPAVCTGLLRPGQIGRSARFIFQTPYTSSYSARFQTHFGFINPNAVFVAPSAALNPSVAMAVVLLIGVITSLIF